MGHTLGDPSVSQLGPSSPAIQGTQGAVSPLLGLPFQHHCGHKDSGSSTLRSLWRGLDGQWVIGSEPWGATGEEAPSLVTRDPHTHPTASLQDAASCLVPLHSFVTTFSCVTAAGREQALK